MTGRRPHGTLPPAQVTADLTYDILQELKDTNRLLRKIAGDDEGTFEKLGKVINGKRK